MLSEIKKCLRWPYLLGAILFSLVSCRHIVGQKGSMLPSPDNSQDAPLHVEIFSELSPVTAVALSDRSVYVGNALELRLFDLHSHSSEILGPAQMLPSGTVYALATDLEGGVWGVTKEALFHKRANIVRRIAMEGIEAHQISSLLPHKTGVWIGTSQGLAQVVEEKISWHLRDVPITSLLADLDGAGLWAATVNQGLYHFREGKLSPVREEQGLLIKRPKAMAFGDDGALLVLGTSENQDYLASFDGLQWSNYSLPGQGQSKWIAQVKGQVHFAYGRYVYRLLRLDVPGTKRYQDTVDTPRGPLGFGSALTPKAPADYPSPRYYTSRSLETLPVDVTVVSSQGRYMLLGTPMSGTAIFDGDKVQWLRTNQLAGGESERLKFACAKNGNGWCFLVGENGKIFKYLDGKIVPSNFSLPDGHVAQMFVLDGNGQLLLITMTSQGRTMSLFRLAEQALQPIGQVPLAIPENSRAAVRFARSAPSGDLWIGLRYREENAPNENFMPWGVAVINAQGIVYYHRSTLLPEEIRAPNSLALPDDIRDVYFLGSEIWLATGVGACRVQKNVVDLFSENEGLESEIIYSLARGNDGAIYAASNAGVARFDGKQRWTALEGRLHQPVWSLLTEGEYLWAGTKEGLLKYNQKQLSSPIQKISVGQVMVLDLLRDLKSHLWLLTDEGISLIKEKD